MQAVASDSVFPPSQHTPILSVPDAANDDYFPRLVVDAVSLPP